ncbi:MAG: restriction endonuclease subunit S [Limisphaerales bacterium]
MTLETFFNKFDLFADAPDAVAKMRELVRHLAVTGKLVAQDENDGHALALLDRIAVHKAALAKEGKLRGPTTVSPMSPDEGARVLPSSWTWVRFGEIMVNRDGERIPVSKEERATKAKTYDYYGASGVIDKIDGYLFDKPLLLIGEDGANLINRSTPIAFIARGKYWVNNHAHVLDGISEDFLRYIELHTNAINLESYVTGSAQPKMNQAKMNSIPIALPPLAEQKRIVAKVDELMALCDRLEAQQQERETRHAALARASLARFAENPQPPTLNFLFHPSYAIPPADLRKSILTLAVQGKLVPQDPNDEPAETLVERVSALREQFSPGKRAKAVKRIRELDDAKCSHDVPDSWTWCRLGDLVLDFRYGTSRKCARNVSGVPVLRIPNIQGGRIDSTDLKFTDMPPAEFKELRLQDGDLLLVRSNGSENLVGRSAVASVNDERFAYAGYLVRARLPKQEVFAPFLHVALSTPSVRDQIEGPIRTTSGVKNINTTELSNLVLPLPPLPEQHRIVAKVEQLMALVDALETQLAASRPTAANLLSALLAELTTT